MYMYNEVRLVVLIIHTLYYIVLSIVTGYGTGNC